MQKIIVIGSTGAGKSTLASQLAQTFNITQIELDALYWEADWQPAPTSEFRQRVTDTMQHNTEGWAIDGNYSIVRDLTWQQADTVIWLDYSLRVIYWRLLIRTFKRLLTREVLWDNNRENFRQAFFSKESLFYWAYSVYHTRRETYNDIIASDVYPHLTFIIFKHPSQTKEWMNKLMV